MTVSRLRMISGIGVGQMGDPDADVLRLENLYTNLRAHEAIEDDAVNSDWPLFGQRPLRRAAVRRLGRVAGTPYDADTGCVICAGGLAGIFNVLLSILGPGDEVVLTDPTCADLIDRVHPASGVPRFARLVQRAEEGPQAGRYPRFVLANEPAARLRDRRERVRVAYDQ